MDHDRGRFDPTAETHGRDATPPSHWLATRAIVAAFGTYFCMYAFRKPFTAATFEELSFAGLGYKSVLITAQLAGYTLSKFLGISVVSAWPPRHRAAGIVGLIFVAEVSLLLFAVGPSALGPLFLFCNGLPLGMVFGLVLAYLEGRRLTEAMTAGLCVSFIVSSGVVKSIGRSLILDYGVEERWMPFVTGLLFAIPLLVFVELLHRTPPPDATDVRLRHERRPMTRKHRADFFRRHRMGLTLLVSIYVLLTVIRSIRDDFAVEIWQGLGFTIQPSIYTWSETAVMLGVIVVNGLAVRIIDNRKAFLTSLLLVVGGLTLVLSAVAGHGAGVLPPFAFMVLIGLGMYVPYVAFHTTVFERLIALFREPGNIGYLMYLADFAGYLTYAALLMAKPLLASRPDPLQTFIFVTASVTLVAVLIVGMALYHFSGERLSAARPRPIET